MKPTCERRTRPTLKCRASCCRNPFTRREKLSGTKLTFQRKLFNEKLQSSSQECVMCGSHFYTVIHELTCSSFCQEGYWRYLNS